MNALGLKQFFDLCYFFGRHLGAKGMLHPTAQSLTRKRLHILDAGAVDLADGRYKIELHKGPELDTQFPSR